MLFSRKTLQKIIGILWLIDGLLQLQPQMFTMNMVNGVMRPMLNGQPGAIEASLQFIVDQTTNHLVLVNLLIAVVQLGLGLAFLFLPNRLIKPVVILSIIWSLIVWYGGEGMSMLLTGNASILTGAPGAVLLYPLLGLAVYPRTETESTATKASGEGLISRQFLRLILAANWLLAGLLQLQPNWWQPGQISQAIGGMVGQGGLNTLLVDPVLRTLSHATADLEIPLNITLIVLCLGLGVALTLVKQEQIRPFLIVSIILSVIIWYSAQGFGMILTGMATDFNSGLLLVVIALACWPKASGFGLARARIAREREKIVSSGNAQAG